MTDMTIAQDDLQNFHSTNEQQVRALYDALIEGWNQHDSDAFAAHFAEDAEVIGFDGSQMVGKDDIAATLSAIFADHVTAPYITKVKSIKLLAPDVALLRAIVGMIPIGQTDFNPHTNALQTLLATKRQGQWRITLFQNTPAQFHGRPDLVEAMTDELRQIRQ